MTQMHPALDAALAGTNPTVFGAVRIALNSGVTLRLLTGAGILAFDGETYTGSDPVYGVIQSVEDVEDGTGDEAPALTLSLLPATDAAANTLASAEMQGSQVSIWLGAVDQVSGLVIGEPLLIFLGEIDVPTLKTGKQSRVLELEITSAFERFFLNDDGARLNGRWHKYVWPGETGLDQVTAVTRQIYWGGSPASGVSR